MCRHFDFPLSHLEIQGGDAGERLSLAQRRQDVMVKWYCRNHSLFYRCKCCWGLIIHWWSGFFPGGLGVILLKHFRSTVHVWEHFSDPVWPVPLIIFSPWPYCLISCRLKSKNAKPSLDDSAIWDPPLEIGSPEKVVDSPDQINPVEQNEEPLPLQLMLPAQLKDLKVRVSSVSSPSSFYVQFTQYSSQLKRSAVKTDRRLSTNLPDKRDKI